MTTSMFPIENERCFRDYFNKILSLRVETENKIDDPVQQVQEPAKERPIVLYKICCN